MSGLVSNVFKININILQLLFCEFCCKNFIKINLTGNKSWNIILWLRMASDRSMLSSQCSTMHQIIPTCNTWIILTHCLVSHILQFIFFYISHSHLSTFNKWNFPFGLINVRLLDYYYLLLQQFRPLFKSPLEKPPCASQQPRLHCILGVGCHRSVGPMPSLSYKAFPTTSIKISGMSAAFVLPSLTFCHRASLEARLEQAATNQQFPSWPWCRSWALMPSTNRWGSLVNSWNSKDETNHCW